MTSKKFTTVFVLFLCCFLRSVANENDSNNDNAVDAKEEYVNIFKSIPIVFEYLLSAVEDHPQILENNDIMAFEENFNRNKDNETYRKRSVDHEEENGIIHGISSEGFKEISNLLEYKLEEFSVDFVVDESDSYGDYGEMELKSEEVENKTLIAEQMLEENNDA